MYLHLGGRRLQASGCTAHLGPRIAAEGTLEVHPDYALFCGCGPESLSSGAEAVLLCPLPSLLLLRALTLHSEFALGSHGCFRA